MPIRFLTALLLLGSLAACAGSRANVRMTSRTTAEHQYIQMWIDQEVWRMHLDADGNPLQETAARDGLFRAGRRVRDLTPGEIAEMIERLEAFDARGKAMHARGEGFRRAMEEWAGR